MSWIKITDWAKITKMNKIASMTKEQLNYLKNEYSGTLDFEDHYDLIDDMEYSLISHFDLGSVELDEYDFKKIMGLSFEEYDNKVSDKQKSDVVEDFKYAKSNDLDLLKDFIEENQFKLRFTVGKLNELLNELESLEHDGSKDLGYRKEHVLNGIHKKIL